jgi:hypothetical protein
MGSPCSINFKLHLYGEPGSASTYSQEISCKEFLQATKGSFDQNAESLGSQLQHQYHVNVTKGFPESAMDMQIELSRLNVKQFLDVVECVEGSKNGNQMAKCTELFHQCVGKNTK